MVYRCPNEPQWPRIVVQSSSLPDPRTGTKIAGPLNIIQRAGCRKNLLLNANRGAGQNLADHPDRRGTRRDHRDPVAAMRPSDSAIQPVADT